MSAVNKADLTISDLMISEMDVVKPFNIVELRIRVYHL